MSFMPPVKAYHYLLRHAANIDHIMATPAHSELSHELISDILTGAASFAGDVLAPLNWPGDQRPAQIDGDNVIASPGYKEAYQAFTEAGWNSLSQPEALGGSGLPIVLGAAVNEMVYAANMGFGLCPMLTMSAAKALEAHGSDELKGIYLEKMVSGQWSGAMDLTEPQAGSDLGALRSKAVNKGDGTYAVTGTKIFITWGDHDCAENIIHLVLARLPDAPAGSKGISLFLCPKYLVGDDGKLGPRNRFRPISLEHKLGIHSSPTCIMEFDAATGFLIGEENRGLAAMFTMMNEARLFVGVQGVAIGERAFQGALTFAGERVQGRVIDAPPGTPIIGHPDVRRMLMDSKARLMAARAICMATAAASDMASCLESEDARARAHQREALLTPIAKSYGSDMGVHVASTGIQVFGGMGYIEETGAAQHYRDARIAPIYEGTNGIQAADLVGRKLRRDGGAAMQALMEDIELIKALAGQVSDELGLDFGAEIAALDTGLMALRQGTEIVLSGDDKAALAVSVPYLTLAASVYGGALLIKAAAKGYQAQDEGAVHMQALAKFHASSILPEAGFALARIRGGAGPVMDYPPLALADL